MANQYHEEDIADVFLFPDYAVYSMVVFCLSMGFPKIGTCNEKGGALKANEKPSGTTTCITLFRDGRFWRSSVDMVINSKNGKYTFHTGME